MNNSVVTMYEFLSECTSPLHIGGFGGQNGEVLIHPVDRIPFIQATSLAGVFRDCFSGIYGEKKAENFFGGQEAGSKIRFSDGQFTQRPKLELRPRIKIDKSTGTVKAGKTKGGGIHSGQKFELEYIAAGSKFQFQIYAYEEIEEELVECLKDMQCGIVQFGGQKSNGCGYIRFTSVKAYRYNLKKEDERRAWIEQEKVNEEDLLKKIKTGEGRRRAYRLEVDAKTEGNLLIKAISMRTEEKEPDVVPMKNAAGDFLIPGSSMKGAFRARIEWIAEKIGLPEQYVEEIFGKEMTKSFDGSPAKIRFYDTTLSGNAFSQTRIHIDKFTGGVIYGGLFEEQSVNGSMKIAIDVTGENASICVGLLLFALRDLQAGLFTIGSGFHIGRGYLNISKIQITNAKGKEALIDMKQNSTVDPDEIISQCFESISQAV